MPNHIQVTGAYSKGKNTANELLFYGFFEPGIAATRELLQALRKEVHKEVDEQFHIKLPPPEDGDDVITVVTRRDLNADQEALWVLTGDVRIRFASSDQARAVYHRQRGQRSGNNNGCLYTVDSHRCIVKIPDGTSRIQADTRDLHRIFLGCDAFRHEGQLAIESLMRQSLASLWSQITEAAAKVGNDIGVDAELTSAISAARQKAEDQELDYIELLPTDLLYALEYCRITKLGQASPFVAIDYPETQVPQALKTLLADEDLSLAIPLLVDGQKLELFKAAVYDRNPASRGLDFTEDYDVREDFVKYAVHLRCKTSQDERRGYRMPALDYVAEGINIYLESNLRNKKFINQLKAPLRQVEQDTAWFQNSQATDIINTALNEHMGDHGLKTPGRVEDIDGANVIVASFQSAVGAAITVFTHRIILWFYLDEEAQRLCLDRELTAKRPSAHPRAKKISLTYEASLYNQSVLPQGPPGHPQGLTKWIQNVATNLQNFPPIMAADEVNAMEQDDQELPDYQGEHHPDQEHQEPRHRVHEDNDPMQEEVEVQDYPQQNDRPGHVEDFQDNIGRPPPGIAEAAQAAAARMIAARAAARAEQARQNQEVQQQAAARAEAEAQAAAAQAAAAATATAAASAAVAAQAQAEHQQPLPAAATAAAAAEQRRLQAEAAAAAAAAAAANPASTSAPQTSANHRGQQPGSSKRPPVAHRQTAESAHRNQGKGVSHSPADALRQQGATAGRERSRSPAIGRSGRDPNFENNIYTPLARDKNDSDDSSEDESRSDNRSVGSLSTGAPNAPHLEAEAAEIQQLLSTLTPQEFKRLRDTIQHSRGRQQPPSAATASGASAPGGTGESEELRRRLEDDYSDPEEAAAEKQQNPEDLASEKQNSDPPASGSGGTVA